MKLGYVLCRVRLIICQQNVLSLTIVEYEEGIICAQAHYEIE